MKTEAEIRESIKETEEQYKHVLTGTLATIQINAPRALMQLSAETRLRTLHEVLEEEYKSKLKGTN